jgi:hypothetical protein
LNTFFVLLTTFLVPRFVLCAVHLVPWTVLRAPYFVPTQTFRETYFVPSQVRRTTYLPPRYVLLARPRFLRRTVTVCAAAENEVSLLDIAPPMKTLESTIASAKTNPKTFFM